MKLSVHDKCCSCRFSFNSARHNATSRGRGGEDPHRDKKYRSKTSTHSVRWFPLRADLRTQGADQTSGCNKCRA
jgi:hypothetical protein